MSRVHSRNSRRQRSGSPSSRGSTRGSSRKNTESKQAYLDDEESESVAIHSWQQFLTEYKKMARALQRSQQVQKELLDQVSQMKNEMVNNALRLQVALRLKNDDDKTIYVLRKEAAKAWESANLATHKQSSAQKLITELRAEVKDLREQIDDLKADLFLLQRNQPIKTRPQTGDTRQSKTPRAMRRQVSFKNETQQEPPKTFRSTKGTGHRPSLKSSNLLKVGSFKGQEPIQEEIQLNDELHTTNTLNNTAKSFSAFQEWKVANNIWTPDTPAGSVNHDPHVIAATQAGVSPMFSKRAITRAAMNRPTSSLIQSSSSPLLGTGMASLKLRQTAQF